QEVHHIAWDLRPSALDDLGLKATLLRYVEDWSERSRVEVDFHGAGLDGDRLPPPLETALYRIVQELLTNVAKHARARHVSVILERGPHQVLAIVEDDGCGFDADGVPSCNGDGRGLGLLGVSERVALVDGTFQIESAPGRGTTLFVRIP